MSGIFYLHPRREAAFRAQKPALILATGYVCKCGKRHLSPKGRKKAIGGGWIGPCCATNKKESAPK